MSQFLQNLISRHQENVSLTTSHTVQPRPRARYEADSALSAFAQNNSGPEPIVTGEKDPSRHTQAPAQHGNEKTLTHPHHSRFFDHASEPVENATQQYGKQPIEQRTPIKTTENQTYERTESNQEFIESPGQFLNRQPLQPADAQREKEPQRAQKTNESQFKTVTISDKSVAASELQHRIQNMLSRLNSEQPRYEDDRPVNESLHEPASKADNNVATGTVVLPLVTEQNANSISPAVNLKKQSLENRTEQRESRQSGLMQIPGWLTEIQASLNNRWQEINTKAKPEPVINVTIGRVEVKAVQAEAAKKLKSHNKPSGVMGLDEYLKQRENRGQG
jgi:hypothetical protein